VRRLSPFLSILLLCSLGPAQAQAPTVPSPAGDGVGRLLRQVETSLEANDATAFISLLSPGTAETVSTRVFLNEWIVPGVTRAVVRERLRRAAPKVPEGEAYEVYVDVLTEFGKLGRVGTWVLVIERDPRAPTGWRIASLTVLTTVAGLYRLELNPEKEFTVANLTLSAEDLEVRLPSGIAFVAETYDGTTGIVLMGRGDFTFSPAPLAEKGQVKIFSGSETLQSRFDWLYVRVNPATFSQHFAAAALTPRAVDRRDFRRADLIFQENVSLSFGLDLTDLSREKWSLSPRFGDLVTEIQTDKTHFTYMRSTADPEDIRFVDRARQRTISVYTSKERLAARGPYFSEDDKVPFDILHYDINATFEPQREWMEGRARVLLVAKNGPINTLSMTLAEPLVIRSVVSQKLGYLMALRVTGQNEVIVNLPEDLPPNTILDLEFVYGGRLPAFVPEREALDLAQSENEFFNDTPEPSYIYTGRSGWYPQGPVSDYATANMVLRVPENYSSVGSGALDDGWPKIVRERTRAWKEYQYSATQPVRYLAWAISKFIHVDEATVKLPEPPEDTVRPAGVSYLQADVSVESSTLLKRRALELSLTAQDAMKFYGSIVDDMPYQTFSLAVVERSTPGGHSPPYFASLSQPPATRPIAWRNDPAYFDQFPEFFVAHEAAHQWWGQAVGWKNYHEQWLSEGFSQYFAALYAEHLHRGDSFDKVISQMAEWTVEKSNQGPVYLGYRLGAIKGDSRVFRALVYNKGGLVLHMLRRLMGDEAFFKGVARFYTTWRFKKAGTEDLKAAFEAESHRSLDRFFTRWIYNDTLPRLKFSYKTDGADVVVRFEQVGEVFDVPVTVRLNYVNPTPAASVVIPITEQVTEQRIPLKGILKDVDANSDNAAPVLFVK